MKLILPAHAKINLTLEVLGQRPDGYHEIVTILQAIGLSDTLTFESAETLELAAPGLDCPAAENLVLRAARQLQETYARTRGARICLQKHIPSAAGLGGGSSDAATTLLALNHLWGLDLGLDALSALAAELGSDVPFFLHAPTALAQGRGERLASLPAVDGLWVVLAIPPVTIPQKTRTLYRSLLPADYTDGSLSLAIAADLAAGKGLAVDRLRNAFERQALSVYPAVASCYQALLQAGAPFARLSGSGPAVFTLVRSQAAAHRIVRRLTEMGIHSEPTYTIGREETVLAILQGDD